MAVDADTTEDAITQPGEADDSQNSAVGQHHSRLRLAVAAGLGLAVVLGLLTGWLGYRSYESRTGELQRSLFVQAGRQAALNLTTISYTEADGDVARIVDSSVGNFRTDFQSRAADFINVVKQAQSKSEGVVTEAGLESQDGDQGKVLVSVSVKTTTPADKEPQPRGWRMRITVQQTHNGPKISNVEFVP